jgi:hypothetical protein
VLEQNAIHFLEAGDARRFWNKWWLEKRAELLKE